MNQDKTPLIKNIRISQLTHVIQEMAVILFVHVTYIYSNYTCEDEYEIYSDELYDTMYLLMKEFNKK